MPLLLPTAWLSLVLGLMAPPPQTPAATLTDKTFVAWVAPATLTQKGGSVLSLDDGDGHFDGLVFGELAPARWMAGSDFYRRTRRDQGDRPAETAGPDTFVKLALVYRGNTVTLSRNGTVISQHEIETPQRFDDLAALFVGPRHQGNSDVFQGQIDDLRIYDRALDSAEIAALKPNDPAGPQPWAWFPFDGDKATDRAGHFAGVYLAPGASVAKGRLVLDGPRAALIATATEADLSAFRPRAKPPSITDAPDLPADLAVVRRFRNHLLADPHRPTYHFVMPEDLAMPFDPNGAISWKGRYHLFYIYQEGDTAPPGRKARGPREHVFGHVSSVDMVHWRQHPTPLYPTDVSVDRGMFSGNCFINKQGEATMLFHGVGAGNCIMTSSDENLDVWTRLPSNPIVPIPGADKPYTSWDPHGWLEGQTYYAVFGGIPGNNPKPPAVFKADALDRWTYVGPFLHHDLPGIGADEDISCPDFFEMGGKRVLICIAHNRGARYYVGEWKNEQFVPEVHERLSWSDNLYFAPETLLALDGRRILWAWIFDRRSDATQRARGWSGTYALPREITLGPDNRLRFAPLRELKQLRYDAKELTTIAVPADGEVVLDAIAGNTIELELTIEPGPAQRVGVRVNRSPDRAEETAIVVDLAEHALQIDTRKASLGEGPKGVEAGPYRVEAGQSIVLRVFVDRSVVEAFADDRQAVVRHVYPTRADSLGVSVFAEGGSARIERVRAWKIAPSNPY